MKKPLVIAHRGASASAPENTLAAFQEAIHLGVDLIELDIRFSLDHEAVVIHDETVGRTTNGRGEVGALSIERLRELDAGSWFAEGFAGQRIPTLDEVCRLVAPTTAGLLIEIKGEQGLPSDFASILLAILDRGSMRERSILQSFDHRAVRRLRVEDEALRLALVHDSRAKDPVEATLASGAGTLALRWRLLGRRILDRARESGLGVFVWTVNRERAIRKAISYGVDGIITNHPARALRCRDVKPTTP